MPHNSAEQVVSALREADRMLRAGRTLAEVIAELGISQTTYHRWRRRFAGMNTGDVARVRELEQANARLRRIVADKVLEIDVLREITRGSW